MVLMIKLARAKAWAAWCTRVTWRQEAGCCGEGPFQKMRCGSRLSVLGIICPSLLSVHLLLTTPPTHSPLSHSAFRSYSLLSFFSHFFSHLFFFPFSAKLAFFFLLVDWATSQLVIFTLIAFLRTMLFKMRRCSIDTQSVVSVVAAAWRCLYDCHRRLKLKLCVPLQ